MDDATAARIQLTANHRANKKKTVPLMNLLACCHINQGKERAERGREFRGDIMRTWLEYDLVALAALVLGVAAVELLAFIIG